MSQTIATRSRESRRTIPTVCTEVEPYGEIELEFTFQPYDDEVEIVPISDKRLVAYYVAHDDDGSCCNPLEEGCANGNVYLYNERNCIWTHAGEVLSALCLGSSRWSDCPEPEIESNFVGADGRNMSLMDRAVEARYQAIAGDFDYMRELLEDMELELDEGETLEEWFKADTDAILTHLNDPDNCFNDDIVADAHEMYADNWERLVGPFVVPIDYFSHYETCISPTSWNGDPDDLPSGVWVADDDAIDNILHELCRPYFVKTGSEPKVVKFKRHTGEMDECTTDVPIFDLMSAPENGKVLVHGIRGTRELNQRFMQYHGYRMLDEIRAATIKYADSVLDEVSKWASGEVFGVVVEEFFRNDDGTWEAPDHDSCWGFIGLEYAKEAVESDYAGPIIEKAKEAAAAAGETLI